MGHECVPFSVHYAGSWPSPYNRFFMPPPGPASEVFYRDIKLRPASLVRYIDRSVYSLEARWRLSRLLRETGGADIAYLLNIYNYMSPSIIDTFRKRGIPVVMRLGDYNLQCPSYLFLRAGAPCTLCMQGSYWQGLRHLCVKGSAAASALRVLAMYVHKALNLYGKVAAFVVPCAFMKNQLMQGGFPEERIHVIRSPAVSETAQAAGAGRRHILYFGRISPEKGLDTLIEAWSALADAPDLILAGRSYDGEQERLEKLAPAADRNRITFAGFQDAHRLGKLIDEALLTVVPSRWYDNAPLSVHESFLHATPVVAARIGGIPEQVQDGVTGMLFEPDSARGLRAALQQMLSDRERLECMGRAAYEYVNRECSMGLHAERLLDLLEKVRSHGW
jgi:glycosyltransferase involved in cell wall biosynthesis